VDVAYVKAISASINAFERSKMTYGSEPFEAVTFVKVVTLPYITEMIML
jgi:hypothetical protein